MRDDSHPSPDSWAGPPEPFDTPEKLGDEYPLSALPPLLAGAASAIAERTRAPIGLAANSVLAAAALVCQGAANVYSPKLGERPVSLFILTIARSGERKSSVDRLALEEVRTFQSAARAKYLRDLERYLDAKDLKKTSDWDGEADKLRKPVDPRLMVGDVTPESLKRALAERPSLGFFNDDAAEFLCGHSMKPENAGRTGGGLSKFWDGMPSDRDRIGDPSIIFTGEVRLTAHWMLQPEFAQLFLGNARIRSQGLSARFLISAPKSTIGKRFLKPEDMIDQGPDPRLDAFNERISHLAAQPLRFDEAGALKFRRLACSDEANALWLEWHNACESAMQFGAAFEDMTAEASKSVENALRLAGVLTLFDDPEASVINGDMMLRSCSLTEFYLGEAQRLLDFASASEIDRNAQKLWAWLTSRDGDGARYATFSGMRQRAPRPCRNREVLPALLQRLIELNRVREVCAVTFDGTLHRTAYEIRQLQAGQ